jgi:hypothetical protein
VFLRLFEKDGMQQSSSVVVKFDNHEILAKIGSPASGIVLLGPETKQQASISLPCPRFYTACEA